MKTKRTGVNRRGFLGAVTAAVAIGARGRELSGVQASPAQPPLKMGLVGCGGRGTGAALNALEAADNVQIHALADVFEDRIASCLAELEKVGNPVPIERRFVGFEAYRKVLELPVDCVILATPPHFRPEHFAAAVEAGKHAFIEKPVAVDGAGIKTMLEAAYRSEQKGLCVVAGTQRRHQREYLETYRRVADGAIGEIVAARGAWNQAALWHRKPEPGWSEMEAMVRDWVNWSWLSGDHIVEQHVHQIDVIHWFTGSNPVRAVGMGGRARRPTGDQYDFFAVDFEQPDGVHFHSMCRQINGCADDVSEFLVGTQGSTNCRDTIYSPDGAVVWKYNGEPGRPYVQEHVDLIRAIRTGEPINEARQVTESTLTGVMGRISAYTGKAVTREEALASTRLGPERYDWGAVEVDKSVPTPGRGV